MQPVSSGRPDQNRARHRPSGTPLLLVILTALVVTLGPVTPPARVAAAQDACPEPNDEFQQACELRPGAPVSGVLASGHDVDAYRVEAVNFHAHLRLALDGDSADYALSLANWNGDVLASSAPGGPAVVEQIVGPPGAYYVFIHAPAAQVDPARPYSLSYDVAYPDGSSPEVLFSSAFRTSNNPGCTASRGPAATTCLDEGGRFTIEIGAGSSAAEPTAAWLWVGPRVSDFTLTVDTRLVKDARNAAVQIDVRAQDYDNGYGVALVPREGLVVVSRSVAGQVTELARASRSDATTRTGVNRVTVTAVGTALSVAVNGQLVAEAADPTFDAGRVGFFAYTFDEPFTVRIDNVLLTMPARHPCRPSLDPPGGSAPCPP